MRLQAAAPAEAGAVQLHQGALLPARGATKHHVQSQTSLDVRKRMLTPDGGRPRPLERHNVPANRKSHSAVRPLKWQSRRLNLLVARFRRGIDQARRFFKNRA